MTRIIKPLGKDYVPRVVDDQFDALLGQLPALSIVGPRGVGKTRTAERKARSQWLLDSSEQLEIVRAEPPLLTEGPYPTLIDEWQRYPESWDVVRRAVDHPDFTGRFILTGSAAPAQTPTHTGAARITPMRMRPMTLVERGFETPTVSLHELLTGSRVDVAGTTSARLRDYGAEILTGGFPGMRYQEARAQRAALDGYLEGIITIELPELGVGARSPDMLRRWLRAYAAATATVTSFEKIRLAAAGGQSPPAKSTAIPYRDALSRIWIVDEVPAWVPTRNHMRKLVGVPKHHLADPALAAQLMGLDFNALIRGEGPDEFARDGTFLGALFESLAAQSIRVFSQASEARTFHLRTDAGVHEIDLIVQKPDQRVVAFEVKLGAVVEDRDVRHLHWLRDQLGDEMLDGVVLSTGSTAYRRQDGFAVVPLALLGP